MKRFADAWAAMGLLVVLALPLAIIAACIAISDGPPVFFWQERMGREGKPFRILKFRTMRQAKKGDALVTQGQKDDRITRTGKWLRQHRLDEFPQLWNVLIGEMSLVGPRPEVPRFVDMSDPDWQTALSVRPGITGPDALAFRDEGTELAQAADAEAHYREVLLPKKLSMQADYARTRSLLGDVQLLIRTFGALRG